MTEDGRAVGWACRPGHVARLHIGIFEAGRLLAEAATHGYRADLLVAGHGLGHCAFAARLRENPAPGQHELSLRLLDKRAVALRFMIKVPPIRKPLLSAVGAPAASWTDEEILQNLAAFELPVQLGLLGPRRFVEGATQFVLGRWAQAPVIEAAERDVAAGAFDPDDFVERLIVSHERQARAAEPLPTPFETRFPFVYPYPVG